MEYKTRYITPDDFLQYFGIDLGARLKGDANPSDKANAFIMRLEDRMEAYLNATFFKKVPNEWMCFSDYQKDCYRKALLEQAIYIFKQGDISVNLSIASGDLMNVDLDKVKQLSIAPNAKMYLELCGLWSRKIRTGNWFGGWLWGI